MTDATTGTGARAGAAVLRSAEERGGDWLAANPRHLQAALDVVRLSLAGPPDGPEVKDAVRLRDEVRRAMPAPPALENVRHGFGLSDFELDVLLMCAGTELDAAFAATCAELNGDPARAYATFAMGLAKLPGAHWTALSPAGPLRRWHLLTPVHPDAPLNSALHVEERVLHALSGISCLDHRIAPLAERLPPPDPLLASLQRAADALRTHRSGGANTVLLYGRGRAELRSVAAACAAPRATAWCLRASDLPTEPSDLERLARLCERETLLDGAAWVIDTCAGSSEDRQRALHLADRLDEPVVILAQERISGAHARTVSVEVEPPAPGEAQSVWRQVLGPATRVPPAWIGRVAGQFSLGTDAIRAASAEVRVRAAVTGTADPDALGTLLWDVCRQQARQELDGLAQRVEPRADWADLVLPTAQTRLLEQITAHVRHRLTVLDDWGFARHAPRGHGTAALFTGPSGTGKTLAAEVIAGTLRLDLYRVDLSQVVSKYIGETERNLRRIFDAAEAAGAVLLFDEADALFGKRSEVRDSHDRYANQEVSYLLQRVETYRGLAVLTTNLKDAVDSAFLRRLRFLVHFPFPDAAARAELWRRAFPPQTPTEGLDPLALARLSVCGGTIHSIAVSAAYLAAEAGEPVRMCHLLTAARTEYAKLERPLTDTETTGWA